VQHVRCLFFGSYLDIYVYYSGSRFFQSHKSPSICKIIDKEFISIISLLFFDYIICQSICFSLIRLNYKKYLGVSFILLPLNIHLSCPLTLPTSPFTSLVKGGVLNSSLWFPCMRSTVNIYETFLKALNTCPTKV
jgi:hypothetical protein